jgi:hypothetical protein
MALDDEVLTREIQLQLDGDLLSYGWLRQIVRELYPAIQKKMVTALVYESVARLFDSRIAIIGNACEIDGVVRVVPWSGNRDEVLDKLKSFMWGAGENPSQEDLNGFWIERAGIP